MAIIVFNGKTYKDYGEYPNQIEASRVARGIRKQGFFARVTRIYYRRTGQVRWEVWCRPGKNARATDRKLVYLWGRAASSL